MIIKKKQFAFSRKTRDAWPFTVPEVAIFICRPKDDLIFFAIVHDFGCFALSGGLEEYGFTPLEQSGIWANDSEIPGAKKNLTPFFEYLDRRLKQ